MGLPLFVAPVEKDVNLKASGKDRVLGPSRSAIRRQPSSRERQNNPARSTALRALGIPHPTLPPAPERYFPWVTSDVSVDPERRTVESRAPEPWRAVLRDISRTSRPRETALDDDTSPPFSTWPELRSPPSARRDNDYRTTDLVRWPIEPRPRARRARVVPPVDLDTRPLNRRSDRRPRTINSPPPPPPGHQPEDPRHVAPAQREQSAASTTRTVRATRDRTGVSHDPVGRRIQSFRFTRSVDGLGDRDRSLSPDWDTLLTTLTPDPQPPSAGSSFASAAVPQTTTRVSSVPPSAPDRIEDAPLDPACESGCEMSDSEELFLEEYHRRMHRRRAELRQTSLRIPDFNLDVSSEGPFARRSGSPSLPSDVAQRIAHLRSQADAWAGRLWGGPSEDETETDRSRQNREDSVGVGHGTFAADDDWTGMQRIVRSLAARGDIPDEWWAEVGLSRTLRQEETS